MKKNDKEKLLITYSNWRVEIMADYKGYLQDKNNNNLYLEDYDTGWKNLTLLVGSAGFAKYRRVGKMVQILILNFTEWQYNQNFLRIHILKSHSIPYSSLFFL